MQVFCNIIRRRHQKIQNRAACIVLGCNLMKSAIKIQESLGMLVVRDRLLYSSLFLFIRNVSMTKTFPDKIGKL